MRGKLFERYILGNWVRITPAGAGKTIAVSLVFFALEDHPRRCGENPSAICPFFLGSGSPPQVRGKQGTDIPLIETLRITPAGAGKTYLKISFLSVLQDHPRRCGENQQASF